MIGVIDAIGPMNGMEMRLSLDTMRQVYGNYQPAELAVEARNAETRPALEAKIAALLDRKYPNLEMQSAADAKKEVSDEINRTFNMFNAIVIIAIIVSLLGVINTLAMSVIERTREIGVLRALGASRWQIRATMLDESLMITIAGAVVGVLAGTLIGYTWLRGVDEVMPGLTLPFPRTDRRRGRHRIGRPRRPRRDSAREACGTAQGDRGAGVRVGHAARASRAPAR